MWEILTRVITGAAANHTPCSPSIALAKELKCRDILILSAFLYIKH
jgi:hypothetical protein